MVTFLTRKPLISGCCGSIIKISINELVELRELVDFEPRKTHSKIESVA